MTANASPDKRDWDIAVCGLNCARCQVAQEGKCQRCRGPVEHHWCGNCPMLTCARDKGHRYCFECDDFPCQKLQAFADDGHEHHRLTLQNLMAMKELGLQTWIAQQEKPMFCTGWRL
jgi:hypothetical protein